MGKLRWTIQFISLALVNIGFLQVLKIGVCGPFFYCYGCPAAAFACPIGVLQNYAIFKQFPFYALGILGLFGLALGRFWCGWVCPFGTVQDLIMWLRRRQDFIKLSPAAWTKFVVLAGAILIAWLATDTLFCKVCPAGSLFAAIPYRFVSPELPFGTFFYVHLITLAIALVAFYLIGRFWCRYLCPLGGIFAVFNRLSILKMKVDMSQCTHCKECLIACPVKIENPEDIESSTDCIRCGKCIDACHDKAIQISASLRD